MDNYSAYGLPNTLKKSKFSLITFQITRELEINIKNKIKQKVK